MRAGNDPAASRASLTPLLRRALDFLVRELDEDIACVSSDSVLTDDAVWRRRDEGAV